MRHFPVFLDLHRSRALVIGSGEVAARKAELLARAGAEVRIEPAFDPSVLDGIAVAIGAGAPEVELHALSAAAMARGIPVNIVDRPALCSFILPALVDRDPITIAVSTAGTAPVLARLLRARIEAAVPPAFGRLAALADRFKAEIRTRLPDLGRRRAVLEGVFQGRVAELVFVGEEQKAESAFAEAIAAGECQTQAGKVYLVGAGPGAGDLLTLRAHRLLGEADVIVHDRLVSDEILDMARRDAARIYVGKRRAEHCMAQGDINALLVRLAREGKRVVRLKGGDPFVFGRGGEELEALEAAGIDTEIVPGVTAALACAAQARIPLTHRAVSRSVTFVTGHTRDGRLDVDFASLARPGATLAVYMGVSTLRDMCAGLIAHGLSSKTPAALIEQGGSRRQRELYSDVGSMGDLAPGWSTGAPALLMIGEVVGYGTTRLPAEFAFATS